VKLGLIVRQDVSGLSVQTHNFYRMLKPDRIMVIDSRPFNGRPQHPEMYSAHDPNQRMTIRGFPGRAECAQFLNGLTHVLTCEIPYNYYLYSLAAMRGIKTYQQYNFEFLDHLKDPLTAFPTEFIAPSPWRMDEVEALGIPVTLLPPPTFPEDFAEAREVNARRTGRRRFLHIAGRPAAHDRNGTLSLLEAMSYAKEDFELVIKAQEPLGVEVSDPRVTVDYSSPDDNTKLYEDFDAMVMPRRYGGLCLPMNEAMMAGLPCLMTDIEPNSSVLPKEFLSTAVHKAVFMARTNVDVHSADAGEYAMMLDRFAVMHSSELSRLKQRAFELAHELLSPEVLRPRYERLFAS
jgi:glycosyltransferase involved in cell wall biosynthesis